MTDLRGRVVLPGQQPIEIRDQSSLSFGREAPGQAVDLSVSGSPRVSRRAGVLEATPYGVLITNTGSNPIFVRMGAEPTSISLRPGQAYLVTSGVARVTFYLDGSQIAQDTTAPYSVSWKPKSNLRGVHTLTAVAADVAGNTTTSAPVRVNLG